LVDQHKVIIQRTHPSTIIKGDLRKALYKAVNLPDCLGHQPTCTTLHNSPYVWEVWATAVYVYCIIL